MEKYREDAGECPFDHRPSDDGEGVQKLFANQNAGDDALYLVSTSTILEGP